MDIQTKKLLFLEEFIRLNNEEVIEKLALLLKKEKQRLLQKTLSPMTHEELAATLDRSEQDIAQGHLHSQQEVEVYFKEKRRK